MPSGAICLIALSVTLSDQETCASKQLAPHPSTRNCKPLWAAFQPVNFLPQTCDSSETRSHPLACRILDVPPPISPAASGNLLLLPKTQPPPPPLGSQMPPLKLMGRPHSSSRVELPMPGNSYNRPPTTPRRALQTSP